MFRLLGSSLGGLVTTPYSCPLGEKELPRFDGCLLAPPATVVAEPWLDEHGGIGCG